MNKEQKIDFGPEDFKNKKVTIRISAEDTLENHKTDRESEIIIMFDNTGYNINGDSGFTDPKNPIEQLQCMVFSAIPGGVKKYFNPDFQ